jgi:hypothetical protein
MAQENDLTDKEKSSMAERKNFGWEERLEKKVRDLEKRIDDVGKKVETEVAAASRRVEREADKATEKVKKAGNGSNLFWGIVFLALGIFWLGRNFHWFFEDLPWLPVLLIAGGITLLIRSWDNQGDEKKKRDKKS